MVYFIKGRQDISQLLSLTKTKPVPGPGINNWYQSNNKEAKEEEDGMSHTDEEVCTTFQLDVLECQLMITWPYC